MEPTPRSLAPTSPPEPTENKAVPNVAVMTWVFTCFAIAVWLVFCVMLTRLLPTLSQIFSEMGIQRISMPGLLLIEEGRLLSAFPLLPYLLGIGGTALLAFVMRAISTRAQVIVFCSLLGLVVVHGGLLFHLVSQIRAAIG
jgi:hypothetical protein